MEKELNIIKAKIEQYKNEYNSAASSLKQKTTEAEGLMEGVKKYQDNQQMLSQLKPLLIKKYNEIKELNTKLEAITSKAKKAKLELDALFNNLNNNHQTINPQVISASTTCEKVLSQVMHDKKQEPKISKTTPVIISKPVVIKEEPKIEIAENKEQIAKESAPVKAVINPPKAQPKKTLNDVAKSEASAQEKYLQSKSQNLKSYGQA